MAKKTAKKAAKKAATKKTAAKKAATKKKAPSKKAPSKKAAAKKSPVKKKAATTKTAAKKPAPKKKAAKKEAPKRAPSKAKAKAAAITEDDLPPLPVRPKRSDKPVKLSTFEQKQKQRLLDLRDSMVDTMAGVAKDNLRGAADSGDSSAFGMHQADAGSDAYDRDFALNLLSQEQDALEEIEEALKRLEYGTYGVCEMSGKKIMHARLEAIPFTRYTVECQAQIEKENGGRAGRRHMGRAAIFNLMDEGSTLETAADQD